MAKAEASVEELVGMIERGELRLPEMQRRYVWGRPGSAIFSTRSTGATHPEPSCCGKPMKPFRCRRWPSVSS
jgi:hypothetical protein